MKAKFQNYFPPAKTFFDELWGNAFFVPDANILLDMYRYSEPTRNELIEVFEKLKDRVWVPYQAALEFSRNRPDVISTQVNMYEKAKKVLVNLREFAEEQVRKNLDFRVHPSLDKGEFYKEIEKSLGEVQSKIEKYEKEHPDFLSDDPVLNRILELFDKRVGDPYDEKRLDEIFKEGKTRYDADVPPGYADARGPNKKEGNAAYGDLVLWYQIIDKASKSKKPIVFLSNDVKEDWWWVSKGKRLGCRPELIAEIAEKAKVAFHMYTAERFLEIAKDNIDHTIKSESIEEIKNVRQKDEENRKVINRIYNRVLLDKLKELDKPNIGELTSLSNIYNSSIDKYYNDKINAFISDPKAIEHNTSLIDELRKQLKLHNTSRYLVNIPENSYSILNKLEQYENIKALLENYSHEPAISESNDDTDDV